MSNINIALTEDELATAISGLLFSCSVNVVSNTTLDYQVKLLDLARKLKQLKPEVKLNDVQFVKEDEYEDQLSVGLYEDFKDNLEIVSFDHV